MTAKGFRKGKESITTWQMPVIPAELMQLECAHSLVRLRSQIPVSFPPLVTIGQLFAQHIHATTLVEQQLAHLCMDGFIRKYQLALPSEHGLILTSDVAVQLERAARKHRKGFEAEEAGDNRTIPVNNSNEVWSAFGFDQEKTHHGAVNREVRKDLFDRYLAWLKDFSCQTVHVSREKLANEVCATPTEINKLVSCGFFTIKDEHSLTLAFPSSGQYIRAFEKSKQEIVSTLKRKRNREFLEKQLIDKLQALSTGSRSSLPPALVIYELIGVGLLERRNTPSGDMIRLTSKSSDMEKMMKW
ncbi:serine-threonine protein kinase 19 [Cladochytrium replicatum]|nr:serine-threonine protein kinase 19 [Cladochytrium replicatum]